MSQNGRKRFRVENVSASGLRTVRSRTLQTTRHGITHRPGPIIIPTPLLIPPPAVSGDGDDPQPGEVFPQETGLPPARHERVQTSRRRRKRPTTGKAKKSLASRYPMREWTGYGRRGGYKQEYLLELIRRKGRLSNPPMTCASCGVDPEPNFRCVECSPGRLECQSSCVKRHRQMPLHKIEEWTGTFFEITSLKEMGLRVQLGHDDGHVCFQPLRGPDDMIMIHTNGIHVVAVNYCNCSQRVPPRCQLLRFGWFPATVHRPRTCASFPALELFHSLTLTGKLTGYDFYKAQTYLTDATGMVLLKSRYMSFMRMARQWRHLHLLLWAGKGCETDGATNVGPGELAIVCPACPIPGVNLPDGWDEAPPLIRWLYTLFIAMDANFCLKSLLRSDETSDPGLHTGNAYFVDEDKYKAHISKYPAQTDVSSCSGFQTLAHAETKNNAGLRATGVVACVCARHEMVPSLGLGDLQKGEKYCNMDYVLLSGIQGVAIKDIFFSYDIVCQWSVNLADRMREMPEHLQISEDIAVAFGVPKMHCPAHIKKCQVRYAMTIQPRVGRTDGEGIERVWAFVCGCAASMKEMGPGSRHDILDDQFHYHNWCKYIAMGTAFAKKRTTAQRELRRQTEVHQVFTDCLPSTGLAQKWTDEVTTWENDMDGSPSPYMTEVEHETEAVMLHRLQEEERQEAGRSHVRLHETGPTAFLGMGLWIEDLQQRIRVDSEGEQELTNAEAVELHRKRVRLTKRIKLFQKAQLIYLPGAALALAEEAVATTDLVEVEDQRLWMPSEFEGEARNTSCHAGLCSLEESLREAQCLDALESIRSSQRTMRAFLAFRNRNLRGQAQMTRAVATVQQQMARSRFAEEKYNRARAALLSLRGPGDWESRLRILKPEDVQSFQGSDFNADVLMSVGEGRRTMSWIWLVEGGLGDGSDEDLIEAARAEWLKSWARVARWSEEVQLLEEEMRRVEVTLSHKADWWQAKREGLGSVALEIAEGACAYADKQATILRRLAVSFAMLWGSGGEYEEEEWVDEEDAESDPGVLPDSDELD